MKVKIGCSFTGCTRPFFGRGLCNMHYQRWRKHGDPSIVKVAIVDPRKALAKRWPARDDEVRFWEKVRKTDTCWIWMASLDHAGYGQFHRWDNGRKVMRKAHRVAYELKNGECPPDMCVLHSCDNPKCVRPEHLRLGTRSGNKKDQVDRHRIIFGDNCSWSKLDSTQVSQIRERIINGERLVDLAKEYRVSPSNLSRIKTGDSWGWMLCR